MRKLILALLLGLVGLSFCHSDRANAVAFNACSTWGTPDGNAAFGVMVCMGTGSAPPTACPQGTGFPTDGCAAAPAPLTAQFRQANGFQPGGYLNTIAGTPSNYMNTNCGPSGTAACRPPWNVAGIDYAIGNYTPIGSLADPATPGLIAGCTYDITTSGTGGGLLFCNSTAFEGIIQHVNFGPVGGHGCTGIWISNHDPAVTSLLIDDLYFFNDTGLCSFAVSNNGIWLNISGSNWSSGITITSSYLDFNSSQWDSKIGGCITAVQCNPDKISLGTNNTALMKYLVIKNSSGNPLTSAFGNTAPTQSLQYDWIEAWNTRAPNGHAEAFDGLSGSSVSGYLTNSILGSLTFDHNVILQGQAVSTFGPTPLWLTSAYPVQVNSGPTITNNVVVNSFVGGRPQGGVTITGCVGATYSGGCVTGAINNTLFVTSETAPVGYGAGFNCTGQSIMTYKLIPGPYPSGVIEEYETDGFSGFLYGPTWNALASPFACTGVSVVAGSGISGNDAVTAASGFSPFDSPNYSNNYVDVESFNGSVGSQSIWELSSTNPAIPFTGTITTTGGVSTLTTGAVNIGAGSYVNGTGVGSCVSGLTSCPRVASGSAGTYVLDNPVTAIGPIAMTGTQYNWCRHTAVVANNVDMTAIMPLSWLNQISIVTSGNGC